MEKKKHINVRLSTVLIIIILVLIGVLVYSTLQNIELKNKQSQSEKEIQSVHSKQQELQNTIDELKNTTNTKNTVEEKLDNESSTDNIISEQANTIDLSNKKINLQDFLGIQLKGDDDNDLTIKSIEGNRIVFELSLFRITTFDKITAIYNEKTNTAEFNTNDTDMGDFWKNIYGTLKFEPKKITMEINESKCEYVDTGKQVFYKD